MQYTIWVEEGKYSVVQKALHTLIKQSKPASQLYLTFDPRISGVQMAATLKAQYPEEMTILLNDQFWNLKVKDDLFSVELVFDDQQHLIVVPFKALLTFIDPDAKFALQFNPHVFQTEVETPETEKAYGSRVIVLDKFRKGNADPVEKN